MTAPLDEMVDGRGGLRPHWRNLLGVLTELGRETLLERATRLDCAFEEEGAASVLPGAEAEPRRCDPIPLPLSETEFSTIAAGLAQRAQVFEAVLRDVYGPQQLLADGALPPALVFANPSFLRPCRAPDALGFDRKLRFYAADLVRRPDGVWCVVADHTGWADGVAAAIENRRMLARIVPEVFHPQAVRQLRPFTEAWGDSLQRLAPLPGAAAVALLTPGHSDPAWYDHVLLARALGCELVEGGDLTVRSGGVFLKTLRGLQPIGVLLRALPGPKLDPLELEPDGAVAAGLLDAARAGAIAIVNHPGTDLTEAPAFGQFLPALAVHLTGEALLLDSLETRWLGEPGAIEAVLANPRAWAIRSASESGTVPAALGGLSQGDRERLLGEVAAAPWRYAASRPVAPSLAPCVGPHGLLARPVVLRVFLMCDGGEWQPMQGGLVRALPAEEEIAWRLPDRGLAKDLWVMAESAGSIVGPGFAALPPIPIRRTSGDLPSRAADNFFWLGRYLERLEGSARLQRAAISRIARAAPTPRDMAEVAVLGDCLAEARLIDATVDSSLGPDALTSALLQAARDKGRTVWLLDQVSRMTNLLRDRLTREMHGLLSRELRELAETLRQVREAPDGAGVDVLDHAMIAVLHFAAAVAGLAAENMVRGGGRLFLDLGRRIERAQLIAGELACALAQPSPALQTGRVDLALRIGLELRNSVITYRSRYLAVLQPAPALDLMLADEGNPRGLAYQLAQARDLLGEIAGAADNPLAAGFGDLFEETQAMVRSVANAADQNEAAIELAPKLTVLKRAISEVSDEVARRYFALLPAARPVGLGVRPALLGAA